MLLMSPCAKKIKMSMMGGFQYFLILQVYKSKKGTFINQVEYYKELLQSFSVEKLKSISTPMSTLCSMYKDEERKVVEKRKY